MHEVLKWTIVHFENNRDMILKLFDFLAPKQSQVVVPIDAPHSNLPDGTLPREDG